MKFSIVNSSFVLSPAGLAGLVNYGYARREIHVCLQINLVE